MKFKEKKVICNSHGNVNLIFSYFDNSILEHFIKDLRFLVVQLYIININAIVKQLGKTNNEMNKNADNNSLKTQCYSYFGTMPQSFVSIHNPSYMSAHHSDPRSLDFC